MTLCKSTKDLRKRAGALQAMVYLAGQAPFRRPVIVGTELVSFSALLTCRHAGIRPAAMIESGADSFDR